MNISQLKKKKKKKSETKITHTCVFKSLVLCMTLPPNSLRKLSSPESQASVQSLELLRISPRVHGRVHEGPSCTGGADSRGGAAEEGADTDPDTTDGAANEAEAEEEGGGGGGGA